MDTKVYWKSRVLWVNLISLVLVIIAEMAKPMYGLPAEVVQYAALVTPILNIILRFLTNQSLTMGEAKPQE
jgi:uncharacterized membrane protein